MPQSNADLELCRQSFVVNGLRVRARPDVQAEQADQLLKRGLVELHEDYDRFQPDDAQKCLHVTQYGFDLTLGRIPA